MLDIIILLALAVFFITRLRKILGMKIDENPDDFKDRLQKQLGRNEKEKVVVLRRQGEKETPKQDVDATLLAAIQNPQVKEGLEAIGAEDKEFSLESFQEGAKAAFEMILEAYKMQDKDTLKTLLSPEVFAEFEDAMNESDKDEVKEENTLVAIQTAEITKAVIEGRKAVITVQFVSEQISLKRNKAGEIVEGDPSQPQLVTDEWTFSHELRSSDPNWLLVAV